MHSAESSPNKVTQNPYKRLISDNPDAFEVQPDPNPQESYSPKVKLR
jgi:hypothetical protein